MKRDDVDNERSGHGAQTEGGKTELYGDEGTTAS